MFIKKENYREFEIKRLAFFEAPEGSKPQPTVKVDRENNEITLTKEVQQKPSNYEQAVVKSADQIAKQGIPLAQAAVDSSTILQIEKKEVEVVSEKIKQCIEALKQKMPPPTINELMNALESKSELFITIENVSISDQLDAVKLYLSELFEKAGVGNVTKVVPSSMHRNIKISPTFSIDGITVLDEEVTGEDGKKNIIKVPTEIKYRYSLKPIANGEMFSVGLLPGETDKNELGAKAAEAAWNGRCPSNKVEDLIKTVISLNKLSIGIRSDAKKIIE